MKQVWQARLVSFEGTERLSYGATTHFSVISMLLSGYHRVLIRPPYRTYCQALDNRPCARKTPITLGANSVSVLDPV